MILYAFICRSDPEHRYCPTWRDRPPPTPPRCHTCGGEMEARQLWILDLAGGESSGEGGPRRARIAPLPPVAPAQGADRGSKPSSAADAHCGVCWARPGPDGSLDHDSSCPALLAAVLPVQGDGIHDGLAYRTETSGVGFPE